MDLINKLKALIVNSGEESLYSDSIMQIALKNKSEHDIKDDLSLTKNGKSFYAEFLKLNTLALSAETKKHWASFENIIKILDLSLFDDISKLQDSHGNTLLDVAAIEGSFNIVNYLIEKSQNMILSHSHLNTGFMNAFKNNEYEKIKTFFEEKIRIPEDLKIKFFNESLDMFGKYYHDLAQQGKLDNMKKMHQSFPSKFFKNIFLYKNQNNDTALTWAAFRGQFDVTEYLLTLDTDHSLRAIKDANNRDYLDYVNYGIENATNKKNYSEVKRLLEKFENASLSYLVRKNPPKSAEIILSDQFIEYLNKADVLSMKEMVKNLPKSFIAKLFIDHKANINATFTKAAESESNEVMSFMLEMDLKFHFLQSDTTLYFEDYVDHLILKDHARKAEYNELISFLKNNPRIKDPYPVSGKSFIDILGNKWLQYAKTNNIQKLKEFEKNFPSNIFEKLFIYKDEQNENALTWAISKHHYEVADYLLALDKNNILKKTKNDYNEDYIDILNKHFDDLALRRDYSSIKMILNKYKEAKLTTKATCYLENQMSTYISQKDFDKLLEVKETIPEIINACYKDNVKELHSQFMDALKNQKIKVLDQFFLIFQNDTIKNMLRNALISAAGQADLTTLRKLKKCIPAALFKEILNFQDNEGQTALMAASIHHNTACLRWLLSERADRSLKNNKNQNAYMIAKNIGNTNAERIFINASSGQFLYKFVRKDAYTSEDTNLMDIRTKVSN